MCSVLLLVAKTAMKDRKAHSLCGAWSSTMNTAWQIHAINYNVHLFHNTSQQVGAWTPCTTTTPSAPLLLPSLHLTITSEWVAPAQDRQSRPP